MVSDPLLHLKTFLNASEVIEASSPSYRAESLPWAAQKNFHPRLVVRPTTLSSLSNILAYISQTTLDFAVRSQGFGSSSAKDVLISMTAFDGFEFDRENEVVTVGAGQTWGEYYKKMEEVAPDSAVVACRVPCIGIGGSILCGGFSWLSAEYGLTSDPQNMLDAQVVKLDGQVIWALTEPDLLWALRGAGSSFGVVTAFKLRAYRYSQSIFAGPIFLPKVTLPEIGRAVADFTQRSHDGKVAMFLYVLKKELLKSMGVEQDMLVVHAFDSHGEEHGRSIEGFGWALGLKGAIDGTKIMNLKGVADLQGEMDFDLFPFAERGTYSIPEMTQEVVVRSFEWFDSVSAAGDSVKDNGYLIFEVMQKIVFNSSSLSRSSTAWPHPLGARHVLRLGTGCRPDASSSENELAQKLIMKGYDYIFEHYKTTEADFVPNTLEDFHDTKKIFGENDEKLQELKRKYDPGNKLKGPINLNVAA